MLISFSGNNGSGKTHLSIFLHKALVKEGIKVVYVKEFQYLFLDIIKKRFRKKTVEMQKEVIKKRKRNTVAYLLPYIIWLDHFILFSYLTLIYKKNVIIVDRYVLDYSNTWIELGVNNKLIDFLYSLLPKTQIAFYIDVDSKVAFKRFLQREKKKQKLHKSPPHNLNMQFYLRNREIYKELLKRGKYVIINGNAKLPVCEKKVLSYWNKFTSTIE